MDKDRELVKGENVTIIVRDQDNQTVPFVDLVVTFSNGKTVDIKTNEYGMANFKLLEKGPMQITARKQRYSAGFITYEVKESYMFILMIISIIIIVAIPTALYLFYFRKREILELKKIVSGTRVSLIIKNNSNEVMRNLIVIDSVPKGAFYGCNINPVREDRGTYEDLMWEIFELDPGDEVIIEYEAASTGKGFMVKYNDQTFVSDHEE